MISQCWTAEYEAPATRGLHPDRGLLWRGPRRHGRQGGAEGRRGSLEWPLLQLSLSTCEPPAPLPFPLQPPRYLSPSFGLKLKSEISSNLKSIICTVSGVLKPNPTTYNLNSYSYLDGDTEKSKPDSI